MGTLQYSLLQPAVAETNVVAIAPYMFWLMFRNVASDGLVFEDPVNRNVLSRPGCVLASPSWENTGHVSQDYVFNWTRDAAVVAIELAHGQLPTNQPLIDYVQFAQTCQNAGGDFDRASFLINGTPRSNWSDQTDGPALQTLAILELFGQLDGPTQNVAKAVIAANLDFLERVYEGETVNLWEEETGASFFARAVQLQCFQAVMANSLGIPVPGWLGTAIPWLENALQSHWNGQYYQSLLPAPAPPDYRVPYDPNIDVVMAAIYGAVAVTDTKLLASAALLRAQWEDSTSQYFYSINGADRQRTIGPMLGRYPGDKYDGDNDAPADDHPWALCTCNFAELYYRLAGAIAAAGTVPLDANSTQFFNQVGVNTSTSPAEAATAVQSAGDQMLQAIVFHSDHLELSEQFDANDGYEKSVSNLSWSYASFLSAVRARNAI
jgi:glucoamylase